MTQDRLGRSLIFCGGLLVALGCSLNSCTARAGEIRVRVWQDVPTVAGIPPDASGQAYRPQGPRVGLAPRSRVLELPAPAPGGACGQLFEVVSGPAAGRGCYGSR